VKRGMPRLSVDLTYITRSGPTDSDELTWLIAAALVAASMLLSSPLDADFVHGMAPSMAMARAAREI